MSERMTQDQFEELGSKLWHAVHPHPGEVYKGEEYCLTEKQAEMVWGMVGRCAVAYAGAQSAGPQQDGKYPIDRPCSACSAGDREMKYHDHSPPFRKGYGPGAAGFAAPATKPLGALKEARQELDKAELSARREWAIKHIRKAIELVEEARVTAEAEQGKER
jgi:hypothetical protein